MNRAYTVKEIDALRKAVTNHRQYGSAHGIYGRKAHKEYWFPASVQEIEELVRTHMLAGHTAEDLLKEDE